MNLNFDLLPWQREVLSDKTRFKVIQAGRRVGKSRFAVVTALISGLECKETDASVIYVAPTFGMVRVLAWDLLLNLGHGVIQRSNVNNGEIWLINGVKIYTRGADNPDSLRGMKLTYAVLDEAKDLKEDVFEAIIRPALSDLQGGALIIGTPEPGESAFNSQFDLGLSGTDEEWMGRHLTTYDNPLIPRAEIEAAKRTMSTFQFKKEYLASRDVPGADLFKEEWLQYGPEPKHGDYYIAIDLAGFQDINAKGVTKQQKRSLDDTAICVVKVSEDGKWWVKKVEYFRKDVRETAVRILLAIRTYRPIAVGIEKGSLMRAVMPYLEDLMRKNQVFAHIEPVQIGSMSKENRVIYALQGMFEHGRITLDEKGEWFKFKDQLLMFPSPRVHDDGPDALSLIQHLVKTSYQKPDNGEEDWEPLDMVSGI